MSAADVAVREWAAETLHVPVTAPLTEIRAAYRRAALATHPDAGGSVETFLMIQRAYETLTAPVVTAEGVEALAEPAVAVGRRVRLWWGLLVPAVMLAASLVATVVAMPTLSAFMVTLVVTVAVELVAVAVWSALGRPPLRRSNGHSRSGAIELPEEWEPPPPPRPRSAPPRPGRQDDGPRETPPWKQGPPRRRQ